MEQEETQIRNQIAKTKENIIKSIKEKHLKHLTELQAIDITGIKRKEKDIDDLVASTHAQKEAFEFIRDHVAHLSIAIKNHNI